jgi:hypothetical protein
MPGRSPRLSRFLYLAVVFALVGPGLAMAAEPAPSAPQDPGQSSGRTRPPRIYNSVRLQGAPPEIDGKIDDPAWTEGEWSGDYTQQIPTEGATPSVKTELKILYDDKNVYFAIRAYDDPALIHRYPARRDEFSGDIVGVCFDSYFDKRSGFEFDLTAAGTKLDLVLTNEGWDMSWDAVWHGKTGVESDKWVAEFQIPLSQLRYGTQEEQVWGLHAWRWVDRNQEEDQWNLIPRNSTGRMQNIGELHGIRNLPRYRHVELLPHTVGKIDALPKEAGNPYRDGASGHGTVGLDAKVGLTTDFTLDLTVNPDFGQVEADPSVVNLTAYETFFEEKRPFFMEGKNILTLNLDSVATAGDVALSFGTNEMMFYSRRIGQAPHAVPGTRPGEFLEMPDHTSILSAAKVTGKTANGVSLGIVQSVTGRERARLSFDGVERREAVEPTTNYFAGRLQKDWDKGNTVLGGMLTNTHRFTDDPALSFLAGDALTGAIDFLQFFKSRSYVLEAKGAFSHITGDAESIDALKRSPVHFYQRPDADHLGIDAGASSLDGWAGTARFARYGNSKLRWSNMVRWASPGFDLNDIGFLRQADFIINSANVGYLETDPHGPFRQWYANVQREDAFDYSGMRTDSMTDLDVSGTFNSKWTLRASLSRLGEPTDTRLLRGGPAMRKSGFWGTAVGLQSDPSRRVSAGLSMHRHFGAEADTHEAEVEGSLRWRATQRLSLQTLVAYNRNLDDLQYVDTAHPGGETRYLLGRIDQDTFGVTFRADLQLSPDLTIQYYGSPFVSTGRYSAIKRVTSSKASDYADRFDAFTDDEIAFDASANAYHVSEAGGAAYTFANPDFSFREFRSNLVTRWEFKPGSTMYVVWSQGRTSAIDQWGSVGQGFNRLWDTPAANVLLVKFSYWLSM